MDSRIIIAADGENQDVHTIVIDEKYVYHVANGEKITITCTEDCHSLRWIPPQKISLSFTSTVKINSGQDNYIKIAKKKIFLGMGTYFIEVCNSERDLMGLYRKEYDTAPWEPNAVMCDANNSVGIVAYKDKVIIVTRDDKRKELSYSQLMSITSQKMNTLFHYWEDPHNNYEKCNIILDNKVSDYIKSQIKNIQGYMTCKIEYENRLTESERYAIVVYDDKLTIIQRDNKSIELEYKKLFLVSKLPVVSKIEVFYWDNPSEGKMIYDASLSNEIVAYINNEISKIHNAFRLINYREKYFFKIFADNMIVYDKFGAHTEVMFDELIYTEKNGSDTFIFYKERGVNEPDKLPWNLPEDVIGYINEQIGNVQGIAGVKIFVSPTAENIKIEFFNEKKEFRIRRGDKTSPMYNFEEIVSYEVKEFDNSNSLMGSSLLATGALSGGRDAIAGALFAQHSRQKLSKIEIWFTLKHNGEPLMEQVDFVHPFLAFEKGSSSYNEYHSVIIKLTSHLDDIINKYNNQAQDKISSNATQSNLKERSDVIAELREWKELLKEGVITEEEFSAKKKQLMGI